MRKPFHYETHRQPVASVHVFVKRVTLNAILSLAVVVASLAIGSAGYMYFEKMSGLDAFLNAAMILSGMGPLGAVVTTGGKVFAGLYAIASGFLFLAIAGLMLAPLYHRILHRFHVDDVDDFEGEVTPARPKRRQARRR